MLPPCDGQSRLANLHEPDLLSGTKRTNRCVIDEDVYVSPDIDCRIYLLLNVCDRCRHVKSQYSQPRLVDGRIRQEFVEL
jgi:hypothetical protein